MTEAADDTVLPVDINKALSERYLAYALSTITARSLPDVRDGLKPVQRRILYAMQQLRLDPAGGFKKCARVVGDVIGKFHPHGDAAVYDALVRLAQSFAQRYPLVDGQGNFGNVDGDNAAAMRYTESRLTPVAMALLEGIDEDAVDFRDTYDGSEREPVVLPAAFPNLLANGSAGIAVGMATSIPPHNAGELFEAIALMLERPAGAPVSTEDLLRFVQGPDLPTGGVLVEPRDVVAEAYASGRGTLRLRARWDVERLAHGQYQVVVSEIPYQVQKSRLIERLAELLAGKKLPLLADFRDESTEAVRIVLMPRARSVPPEALMEQLFRLTELETRLALNMNVLDARGVPRVMGLRQILEAFIAHRMEVLVRRSRHRLGRILERLEILDGFLVVFLDLDRVIRIIREHDEPKAELMRAFELSERQAEAILNLRLRNLRRLEEIELKRERDRLRRERKDLTALLGDDGLRRKRLREQMLASRDRFAGDPGWARRTLLGEAPTVAPELLEAPVERVPMTVVCSQKGWIRAIRGRFEDPAELRYKEGDGERLILAAQSTDRLDMFTSDGRCYQLAVEKLPGGRGLGEPLGLLVDLAQSAELVALRVHDQAGRVLLATAAGRGFLAELKDLAAQTRAGKQIVNLADGDRLAVVAPVEGDHVAVLGENLRLLIFPLGDLPVMGRGRGVTLQRYRDGGLVAAWTLALEAGLSWAQGQRTRQEKDLRPWLGRRGAAGRLAPRGFPREGLGRAG
jgi:topoisomerase-4 subunit A